MRFIPTSLILLLLSTGLASVTNLTLSFAAESRSTALAQSVSDHASQANTLQQQGTIYRRNGNLTAAIDNYKQALEIYREIESHLDQIATLHALGNTYEPYNIRQATDYYEQALETARKVGDCPWIKYLAEDLGFLYSDHSAQDNLITELFDESRWAAVLLATGESCDSLSDLREQDQAETPAPDFNEQTLVHKSPEHIEESQGAQIKYQTGLTFLEQGQFEQAEEQFRLAIEAFELNLHPFDSNTISRQQDSQAKTYELWQYALVAQNKFAEALDISERGRARGLIQFLAQRYFHNTVFITVDGGATLVGTQPFTTSKLGGLWGSPFRDATVIEYSIIDDPLDSRDKSSKDQSALLYIWVIQPTGEVIFRQQRLNADLTNYIQVTRQSLGIRGRGRASVQTSVDDSIPNLRQLYNLLIQPIEAVLPADETTPVVFVPDEALFFVPFAALLDADNQYLIENHTIQISPSITLLEFIDDTGGLLRPGALDIPQQTLKPLLVGNPVMPTIQATVTDQPEVLPALPWAQREAEVVAELLKVQPLIGPDATETVIKQQITKASILHFATHGLLDNLGINQSIPGQPEAFGGPIAAFDWPGALALAPPSTDDGLLTSLEIASLNLNADLAILSACDTGQGILSSDGVVGLSRAFMAAGVPNLLVSLWTVDDLATARLIETFYREWQVSGDKAQALRQAMLQSIDEYPNPLNWAAFTLVGQIE